MNNDLKPCPFCGGKANIRESSHGHNGDGTFSAKFEIGCPECRVSFGAESVFKIKNGKPEIVKDGYEICVSKWNRRTEYE